MRPANFAKSASRSMRDFELRMMVLLRPSSVISEPIERRSSRSISCGERQRSSPMEANWIRFLSSEPSQKVFSPERDWTTTRESCSALDSGDEASSSRRRERWAR